MTTDLVVEELDAAGAERELPGLAAVLHACVAGGASVNFVLPFGMAESEAWWRRAVLPALAAGERRLLVARADGLLRGTVQLAPAPQPNQPHRADVTKLLVHPDARRLGIGRALMRRVEALARDAGRTLLTLDTEKRGAAHALYLSLGWTRFGVVPGYALSADGARREAAAFFWKDLG